MRVCLFTEPDIIIRPANWGAILFYDYCIKSYHEWYDIPENNRGNNYGLIYIDGFI